MGKLLLAKADATEQGTLTLILQTQQHCIRQGCCWRDLEVFGVVKEKTREK